MKKTFYTIADIARELNTTTDAVRAILTERPDAPLLPTKQHILKIASRALVTY